MPRLKVVLGASLAVSSDSLQLTVYGKTEFGQVR
jgi:hypothetical protein